MFTKTHYKVTNTLFANFYEQSYQSVRSNIYGRTWRIVVSEKVQNNTFVKDCGVEETRRRKRNRKGKGKGYSEVRSFHNKL